MDANLRSELQSRCSASIKQVAKVNRKIADKTIQVKNLEEKVVELRKQVQELGKVKSRIVNDIRFYSKLRIATTNETDQQE